MRKNIQSNFLTILEYTASPITYLETQRGDSKLAYIVYMVEYREDKVKLKK